MQIEQLPVIPVESEDKPIFGDRTGEDFRVLATRRILDDGSNVMPRRTSPADTRDRKVLIREETHQTGTASFVCSRTQSAAKAKTARSDSCVSVG